MPKKIKRSGYYYFVQDMIEQKKKSGIVINMQDAFQEASEPWRVAPPSVRAKFEQMSKTQNKMPVKKYTTFGEDVAVVERRQRELVEADERERMEIKNIVSCQSGYPLGDEHFFVMDVNYFCKTTTEYVISEITILRFSINDGIIDEYHEIVHPGPIPIGYTFEAKESEKAIGLQIPTSNKARSSYVGILSNMYEYLNSTATKSKYLPPIFTLASKVNPIVNFLAQLCDAAGEDSLEFRVYRIHLLFYHLINNVGNSDEQVFPKEALAEEQLALDTFEYNDGLACETHDAVTMPTQCTSSRCKRWVFSMLDFICKVAKINPEVGKHFPTTFDIQEAMNVQKFKVQQAREAPKQLQHGDGFELVTRHKRDSLASRGSRCDSALSSASNASRPQSRTTELRRMQTDFAEALNRPAPELEGSFLRLGKIPASQNPLPGLDKLKLDKK